MVYLSNTILDYVDYKFDIADISNNTDVSYNNFTTNNLYQTKFEDVQYINIVSEFVGEVVSKTTIPVTTIQEVLLYKKNSDGIETKIDSVYLGLDGSGSLILEKTVKQFVDSYFQREEINKTFIDNDIAWLKDAYEHLNTDYDTTTVRETILQSWKTNSMRLLHRELTNIYRAEINSFLYQTDSDGAFIKDSDGNLIPITSGDRTWSFLLPPSVRSNRSKVTSSVNTNGQSIHYSQYKMNKSNSKMSCSDFIKDDSKMKLIGQVRDVSGIAMDNRKNRIVTMITGLLQTHNFREAILKQIPVVADASDWTAYPIKVGDILQFGNITLPLPSVDLSNNLYTPETTTDYGFILYNYLEQTITNYINGLIAVDTSNNCISAGTFVNYADPSDNNISFSEYQLDNLDANTQNKIHLKNKTKITYYSFAVNIVADKSNDNLNGNKIDNTIKELNDVVNDNSRTEDTDIGNKLINIGEDIYEELKIAEGVQFVEDIGNEIIGGVVEVAEEIADFYELAQRRYNEENRHEFNLSMMLQIAMGDLLGSVVGAVLPGSPIQSMESAFKGSGLDQTILAGDSEEAFDLLNKLEAFADSMYVSSSMWKVMGYITKKFKINVNNGIYLLNNLHKILGKFALDVVNGIWNIYKGLFNSMLDIAESMLMIIIPTTNNLKGLLESVINLMYGTDGFLKTVSDLLKTFTMNIMYILLDVFIDGNDTTNYSGISGSTPTKTEGGTDYIASPRDRFDYLTEEMFNSNTDDAIKGLYYGTGSATAKPKVGEQFTDRLPLHSYNLLIEVGLYFMLQIYTLQKMIGIMNTGMAYILGGSYSFGDLNLGEVLVNVLRFVTSFPDPSEITYALGGFISSIKEMTAKEFSGSDLNVLKEVLSGVCTITSNFLYFLYTLINPSASLYDLFAKFFQGVLKGILDIANAIGDAVEDAVEVVEEFFEDAAEVADKAWNSVADALGIDKEAVEQLVSAIAEAIVGAISDAIGAIGDGLKAIADGIKEVGKAAVAIANEAYDALNDTFGKDSALYKGAVEVYDKVTKELAKIGKDLVEVGKKILQIAADIKKKVEAVLRAVGKALEAIADWFSNAWESWKCFWYPNDCRRERDAKNRAQNAKKAKANALGNTLNAAKGTANNLKSSLESQKTNKTTELNTKQNAKELAKQIKDASEAVKIQGKTNADNKAKQAKINDTHSASKTSLANSFQTELITIFKMKLRNIKTNESNTTYAYKPIQFNKATDTYTNVYVYEMSDDIYRVNDQDNEESYEYLSNNFALAQKTTDYPVNTMFFKLIMASIDIPKRKTKIQGLANLEKIRVEYHINFETNSYFYNSVKQSKGRFNITKKHYKYNIPLFTEAHPNNNTVVADSDFLYIDKNNWNTLKELVNTDIYRSVYAFNKG